MRNRMGEGMTLNVHGPELAKALRVRLDELRPLAEAEGRWEEERRQQWEAYRAESAKARQDYEASLNEWRRLPLWRRLITLRPQQQETEVPLGLGLVPPSKTQGYWAQEVERFEKMLALVKDGDTYKMTFDEAIRLGVEVAK